MQRRNSGPKPAPRSRGPEAPCGRGARLAAAHPGLEPGVELQLGATVARHLAWADWARFFSCTITRRPKMVSRYPQRYPKAQNDESPAGAGLLKSFTSLRDFGSPSRARTCDNSINSRMLYQLSYRGTPPHRCSVGVFSPDRRALPTPILRAGRGKFRRASPCRPIPDPLDTLPVALTKRSPALRAWSRPRGGVVTQRTANPCTPVRFRARPPAKVADLNDIFVLSTRSGRVVGRLSIPSSLPSAPECTVDYRRNSQNA